MSYQKLSKADFEKAKNTDIVAYCDAAGIPLKQVNEDSYQGVDHDSLRITPSKNAWYWFSQQKGGYGAMSFAKDYEAMGNISYTEAAKKVLGKDLGEVHREVKPPEPFKFNPEQISANFDQAKNYLTETRNLSESTVEAFHRAGLVEQDKYGNALFLWKAPTPERPVIGCSVQGTRIDHEKYGKRGTLKRIEKNSTTGWGWMTDIGKVTPDKIVFCESAIDAMSYYDMSRRNGVNLKGTRIVSMEGLKPKTVGYVMTATENQLEQEGRKLKSVTLAVDQDEAGSNFIKEMQELQQHPERNKNQIVQQGLKLGPPIQGGQPDKGLGVKDWNELVQSMPKASSGRERTSLSQNQGTRSEPVDKDLMEKRREIARRQSVER